MAQLSRLAKLFIRISDNLTEDDVRNLRALLAIDQVLGKGKVEKATPLEIFNMLVDNETIGNRNLGFLVEVLRNLGKGKLAKEVEELEQEHKMEESKPKDTASAKRPESSRTVAASETDTTRPKDAGPDSSRPGEPEDTEVNETIPVHVHKPAEASSSPDNGDIPDVSHDEEMKQMTSELASLHIKELVRLMEEPNRITPQSDERDTKVKLDNLQAKLNTAAVMGDKAQQFDLYCQIGDLYRTKLHDLQSALRYYQKMTECSKSLTGDIKHAKAYNRLGLTYDSLAIHQEAVRSHKKALEINKCTTNDTTENCVAYKNLASSLELSGEVLDAKTNYESSLAVAIETGHKTEQMDIYCKLGDLHMYKLHEPKASYSFYKEMLLLAIELGTKYMEGLAYNRLGLTCFEMEDDEAALDWHQKHLRVNQDEGDEMEVITAHMNVGSTYGRLGNIDQATSHFNTALQMAQQTGDQHGEMMVYLCMGDMQRKQLQSPRTAIQYYEQHLALARQLGDRYKEGLGYDRLGQAHHDIGEYEVALEWYQKFLKTSQERKDKKDQVTAHISVGNAYRLLGKVERATSHFNTALQMAQQTEDQRGQMRVYFSMGDLQKEQLHSPRTSIQYYEQHLTLARQLGDRREEGTAYNRLGRAHYDMGEYEAALEWDQKNLKIRQESGDKANLLITHKNMANSYQALGNLDLARSHYQSAMAIAIETGNKQEQGDIEKKLAGL